MQAFIVSDMAHRLILLPDDKCSIFRRDPMLSTSDPMLSTS